MKPTCVVSTVETGQVGLLRLHQFRLIAPVQTRYEVVSAGEVVETWYGSDYSHLILVKNPAAEKHGRKDAAP